MVAVMMTPHLLPMAIDELLLKLSNLPDAEVSRLTRSIGSIRGFEASSSQLDAVSESFNFQVDDIAEFLSILSFVNRRVVELDVRGEDLEVAIIEFLSSIQGVEWPDGALQKISRVIVDILGTKEQISDREKTRQLAIGFLDNVESFANYLDLRPNFDQSGDEIQQFVPVIQLRIMTDSVVPERRSIVVQLDVVALEQLKSSIQRLEKKIAAVSLMFPDGKVVK